MRQDTKRLDTALVEQRLARSRTQARALVLDGKVWVDGRRATKLSTPVTGDEVIEVSAEPTGGDADWITAGWVGRGALKLQHALELWTAEGLRVQGRRCLDIGASTGGFTQVLLAHGAEHVLALDVGHGQLDPHICAQSAVTELSGTNIKDVDAQDLGGRVGVVVADLSFISLRKVLPALPDLIDLDADLVLLVKPQFEVGAGQIGRGGVVRSANLRSKAVLDVLETAAARGLAPFGIARSPVRGGSGNVEYLLWLRPAQPGMMDWGLTPQEVQARCADLRSEEER